MVWGPREVVVEVGGVTAAARVGRSEVQEDIGLMDEDVSGEGGEHM